MQDRVKGEGVSYWMPCQIRVKKHAKMEPCIGLQRRRGGKSSVQIFPQEIMDRLLHDWSCIGKIEGHRNAQRAVSCRVEDVANEMKVGVLVLYSESLAIAVSSQKLSRPAATSHVQSLSERTSWTAGRIHGLLEVGENLDTG